MIDPGTRFYNDLPPPQQQHWISQLVKTTAQTQTTPIDHLAYLYHPITYLFCENDQALPIDVQRMMVQMVKDAGVHVVEETCTSGHSPFLSMPERVLEVVERS